jgi:hypothetical protein
VNKGEATLVNTLLRWIVGEGDGSHVHNAAVRLAERVSMTLGAGVRPAHVDAVFTDATSRPRLERGPVPGAVLELLAACWDLDHSRGPASDDLVDAMTDWFRHHQVNTAHPADRARRAGHDGPVADYAAWESGALAAFAAVHATDKYAPDRVEGLLDTDT